MNEAELKAALRAAADAGFPPPNAAQTARLLPAMLRHIGSLDGELRDDLIYTAAAHWIWKHDALAPAQLRLLLETLLDDAHLFHRLGEPDGDGIFTRSFSLLMLPLVILSDQRHDWLDGAEREAIVKQLLTYLNGERDWRGHLPEKGWAHAGAHAADVIGQLAAHPALDVDILAQLLDAVRIIVVRDDTLFEHGEEERLATAVLSVHKRDLLEGTAWQRWLEGFAADLPDDYLASLPRRNNVKRFLQALYFRLGWQEDLDATALRKQLTDTLRAVNVFAR